MRRIFSFMLGATIGGLAGATLALLLAPASGGELRQQMQSRFSSLQQDFQAAAASRQAELKAQLAELKTKTPANS